MSENRSNHLSALVSAALIASTLGLSSAQASDNPFEPSAVSDFTAEIAGMEGKCGEGKCGSGDDEGPVEGEEGYVPSDDT